MKKLLTSNFLLAHIEISYVLYHVQIIPTVDLFCQETCKSIFCYFCFRNASYFMSCFESTCFQDTGMRISHFLIYSVLSSVFLIYILKKGPRLGKQTVSLELHIVCEIFSTSSYPANF